MVKDAVRYRPDYSYDTSLRAEVHEVVAGEQRGDLEAQDWRPALEDVRSECKADWTQDERYEERQKRYRERHGLEAQPVHIADGITFIGRPESLLGGYTGSKKRELLQRLSKGARVTHKRRMVILNMLQAGCTNPQIQDELGCSRQQLELDLAELDSFVGRTYRKLLGSSIRYAKNRSKTGG